MTRDIWVQFPTQLWSWLGDLKQSLFLRLTCLVCCWRDKKRRERIICTILHSLNKGWNKNVISINVLLYYQQQFSFWLTLLACPNCYLHWSRPCQRERPGHFKFCIGIPCPLSGCELGLFFCFLSIFWGSAPEQRRISFFSSSQRRVGGLTWFGSVQKAFAVAFISITCTGTSMGISLCRTYKLAHLEQEPTILRREPVDRRIQGRGKGERKRICSQVRSGQF